MGELAASIAHELNNPLAIVALRAESLLGRTAPGDADRHSLEVIGGEVERMATLVANLLQFSRRSTPEISSVDVGEEIVRTMDLVHYYLRNRGIAIVRDFAADAPMIRADRQQLRQLFLNLITNAADAMASGGTLTASVATAAGETLPEEPEPEPDQRPILSGVAVEIRDTGTGIASENLSRILDPFFTTKPEGKGTGLGLAICRRIVHEHEGTIQVASELGRGTTVRIVFPLTMTQRSLL
jgi:signal transduction histidine kinase